MSESPGARAWTFEPVINLACSRGRDSLRALRTRGKAERFTTRQSERASLASNLLSCCGCSNAAFDTRVASAARPITVAKMKQNKMITPRFVDREIKPAAPCRFIGDNCSTLDFTQRQTRPVKQQVETGYPRSQALSRDIRSTFKDQQQHRGR